eukprot:gene47484-58168_t
MLRGSLWDSSQLSLQAPAYALCTACSPAILRRYREQGAQWVQQVCAQGGELLERESGVQEMLAQVDLEQLCADWSDSDDKEDRNQSQNQNQNDSDGEA